MHVPWSWLSPAQRVSDLADVPAVEVAAGAEVVNMGPHAETLVQEGADVPD